MHSVANLALIPILERLSKFVSRFLLLGIQGIVELFGNSKS